MSTLSWAEVDATTYGNPELSTKARFISDYEMALFDAVTPGEDFYLGKQSGDSVAFRLYGRISGTGTTPLTEFQKVPMTSIPSYVGSATVYRRGIAVPWTGLREDLDRLDTESSVVWGLRDHSARTHNELIYNELVASRSWCYNATTSSTYGFQETSPAGAAGAAFSLFHARKIALQLSKQNVPFADGKMYHAFISPTMHNNLFDDTGANGFVDVAKYANAGADGILNGEVGKLMNVRYSVDNHIIPDAIGTGSAFGSGFFLGFDAVREVIVYPMQLLANMNLGGDFGQQKAIAWLSLLAYKVAWIKASHGQGTVVHYTST